MFPTTEILERPSVVTVLDPPLPRAAIHF